MIIYLPGNSPLNKDELEMFDKFLTKKDLNVYSHEYEHWEDESKDFKLENEINRIKNSVEDKSFNEYGIISKSIGTWTAINLLNELEKTPKFVVLMGLPSSIAEENSEMYTNALRDSKAKIYIIQNDKDPYGSIEVVNNIVKDLDAKIITPEADNHLYPYVSEVWDMIKDLVEIKN